MLFKVKPEGCSSTDLQALVAAVPKPPKQPSWKDPDFHRDAADGFNGGRYSFVAPAQRPTRYPDSPEVQASSGRAVVRITCEQREEGQNSRGALVLHVTALRHIEVTALAPVSTIECSVAFSPKKDRHAIFASWIFDIFGGLSALSGGVVDVAGGKGHLSNAIAALGISCTLVDPFAGLGRDPVFGASQW